MNASRILGIVLIGGGVLGLVYGTFSYSRETHRAQLGTLVFAIRDTQTVNIPVWAGIAAIVVGVALLVAGSRKS
jgi:uncharacterized membrane protein YidH (DUF202 family)